MMKALVKSRPEPGIWLEHVPIPSVDTNEVLIRILKTGICGTDLHILNWDDWAQRNIKTPRIIGHEFIGEIVEIGPGVTGYSVGDRVTAEGHITCGICRNCRAGRRHLCNRAIGIGGGRDGAFAEYLVVPASNLWPVHADIPTEVGAILDPFGNAVHCALSFDVVAEDVLITGAGPIGIMAAAVCRFIGARHIVVTDVNDYRLKLASQMGATRTINVRRESLKEVIRELKMTNGFDIGLEMSGNPAAFNNMIETMYDGGHIALLGFLPPSTEISWDQVIFKGLHLKGIYGREMFETWYKMTQLLRSGCDISKVITHRFPIDQHAQAFEAVRSGESGKVILEWD
ncbi:MAG: L-threonine 3-dehydrogenase [Acidiferrobacterales bacterium]|nr:L-threonine 3-dehydrogenase [Acidiferrobacterales bacterium]